MKLDAFVRVCADSPLIDAALVEQAVAVFRSRRFDLVTNVHPRTLPPGQSVEVVDTRVLTAAIPMMTRPEHREHVTSYFYDNASRFRIHNIASDREYGDLRLVVDTPEDFSAIQAITRRFDRPQWTYGLDDIVQLTRLQESTSNANSNP